MVGKRKESLRQLPATHLHRAHAEVEAQHALNLTLYIPVILQQVGNSSVQVSRLALRLRHLVIVIHSFTATQFTHKSKKLLLGVLERREQHIGKHQRTCIYKRVARNTMLHLQLHKRIECRTRRLLADPFPQCLTLHCQAHGQSKDLRDTLYGETHIGILYRIDPAIDIGQTHTEVLRRHLCQRRNVIGNLALTGKRQHPVVYIYKQFTVIHYTRFIQLHARHNNCNMNITTRR